MGAAVGAYCPDERDAVYPSQRGVRVVAESLDRWRRSGSAGFPIRHLTV
jgi:hypothetical protein